MCDRYGKRKQTSNEQIDELLTRAKADDNDAWTMLYEQFKSYIHKKAWERIHSRDIKQPVELERELFLAGWEGFAQALKRYEPGIAGFLTYAQYDIDHALSDQMRFEFGDEIRYDIVAVITSPNMLVRWAMQYGASVEILGEKIRGKIMEELMKVGKEYGLL